MKITPERLEKLKKAAHQRQLDLTVLLENVHDPHNISAVIRTCESVGIPEIYVLYTEEHLRIERLRMGSQSSSGARKWVDVHYFDELKPCIDYLRNKFDILLGTYMDESATTIYESDMTQSAVIVMGNERDGISPELLSHLDGKIYIPQMGLIQSLNISVACAVTVYEAMRQRQTQGMYDQAVTVEHDLLLADYLQRHQDRHTGNMMINHSDSADKE